MRLNHKLLDWSKIDNPGIRSGIVSDFLNSDGRKHAINLVNAGLLNISDLTCKKIFSHLRTSDSLSIGRQGNLVYMPPFWATFRIEKPENMTISEFMRSLKLLYPVVIYVDPPMEVVFEDVPNDTLFYEQKSLYSSTNPNAHINVDSAWNIETGKQYIKVGVFDTGIDSTHEDLSLLTGYGYFSDFTSFFGDDSHGHGTSVAGIIGAKRNNYFGIAGIAGGNGNDTTGISLIDFKLSSNSGVFYDVEFASASVIDASRSVGSYFNGWAQDLVSVPYTNQTPGYGIHIGNHSYGFRVTASIKDTEFPPIDDGNLDPDGPGGNFSACFLCKEAFLFSLQNGVVNVVARGNITSGGNPTYIGGYYDPIKFPAAFDDSWVISVGASGDDGKRLIGGVNTGTLNEGWFSPQGRDIDLIAPGTKALVTTAKSTQQDTLGFKYRTFNGTSAASPHVSGVVALLMSKYNKNCYSQINLDPADIEFIVQKSATDVDSIGYDVNSGWGRLNAHKALKMIDFPVLQIVHPHDSLISIVKTLHDTISLHSKNNITEFMHGPISSQWPIESERSYVVERLKYEIVYSFKDYMLDSTELLDIWVRQSQTNSLDLHEDTILYYDTTFVTNMVAFEDTFRVEPMAKIIEFTDSTVTLEGYYYHFIEKYGQFNGVLGPIADTEDFWYPINPNTQTPKMAYSIYIRDSTLLNRYDFDCDSLNLLMDSITPYLGINNVLSHEFTDFIIYPNPGLNEVKIFISNPQAGRIVVIDLLGKELTNIRTDASNKYYYLETTDLSKGAYVINYSTDSESKQVRRWIKH